MLKGVLCALGACFFWGMIFVMPQWMEGFGPVEISIGRYAVFGVLSCTIFLAAWLKGKCRYSMTIWKRALQFSLLASFGYYPFVVLAARLASPAMSALILGVAPLVIAFYGSWRKGESRLRDLILPSLLIMIGLVMINAPYFGEGEATLTYALGLVSAVWTLVSWSWYVIVNSKFLKNNPDVSSSDWSTMIGVATFMWVLLFTVALVAVSGEQLSYSRYTTWDLPFLKFLGGSMVMALFCSWLGLYLWNRASLYLPVSLVGQLLVFETIFGLLFVYLAKQSLPPLLEWAGALLFLVAIAYALRTHASNRLQIANNSDDPIK